jgi:hypothetical protein
MLFFLPHCCIVKLIPLYSVLKFRLTIAILYLLLCSCKQTDGIWISASEIDDSGELDVSQTLILKFKGEDVQLTVFSYEIHETDWKFRNDLLVIDNETFQVVSSSDSLILKSDYRKIILRKLDEEPIKSDPDFTGKAFRWQTDQRKGSIDFINNASAFWFSSDTVSMCMEWQIAEYEGHKFLVIDGGIRTKVTLIQSVGEDKIQTKMFLPRDENVNFIRLPPGPSVSLTGSWEEVSRRYDDEEHLPPAFKYRLDFQRDSVQITTVSSDNYRWNRRR